MSTNILTCKKQIIPTRYIILLMIFIVISVNYADRATLSIAGAAVAKDLQLDAIAMGYIFSAFGWLTFAWGWEHVFIMMGVLGFILTFLWVKLIHNPTDHPRMTPEELDFISQNGAVVDMDRSKSGKTQDKTIKFGYIKQMLSNRMMLGVFFGQYFINTITWFFLTWFPIYLVQEKGMSILKVGMVAAIPALCRFAGSDWLSGERASFIQRRTGVRRLFSIDGYGVLLVCCR